MPPRRDPLHHSDINKSNEVGEPEPFVVGTWPRVGLVGLVLTILIVGLFSFASYFGIPFGLTLFLGEPEMASSHSTMLRTPTYGIYEFALVSDMVRLTFIFETDSDSIYIS